MWHSKLKSRSEQKPKPKTKTADEALKTLEWLCARAERSSGDARRLMRGWGVAEADREKVLAALIANRFVDNHRYAAAFVREKTRLSGWGAYKIRQALQRKGVENECIDEALSQINSDESLTRLLSKLDQKLRSVRYATNYELKTKLIRYALSLGYDYSIVQSAVDQKLKELDKSCDEIF